MAFPRVHGSLPSRRRVATSGTRGPFALAVAQFAEKVKTKGDEACRMIALELHSRIVIKSPVGNQELWAANAHAMYGRQTYNLFAEAINSTINSDPSNFTKSGRLRRGVKRARRKSARTLAKEFPLQSGKGYVGGRFRGNWQTSVGSAATGAIDQVDPSGRGTMAAAAAALASFQAGPPIYIMNNLPYGTRLEYEGWSKQAPAGMVRITVAEFNDIVRRVVGGLSE
jgi:hypothetical protein